MRMTVFVWGLLLCNSAAQCPHDRITCGGMCMDPYFKCDGQNHSSLCGGRDDDELGCEDYVCEGIRTKCGGTSGLCMDPFYRCDGRNHSSYCGGQGDDELGCEAYSCERGRSKCGGTSGLCVMNRFRCDKQVDGHTCGGNGDDELGCPIIGQPPTIPSESRGSTPPTTGNDTNPSTGNATNPSTGNATNPRTGNATSDTTGDITPSTTRGDNTPSITRGDITPSTIGDGTPSTTEADVDLTSGNTETGEPVDDTKADIPTGRRKIEAIMKVEEDESSTGATDPLAMWLMAVGVPMVLAAAIWTAAASFSKKRERKQAADKSPLQEDNTPLQEDNTPLQEDNTPPQETVDETVV